MTTPTGAHLFRPRQLLGPADLEWAKRRLALVDGHHVARVHGRHGVLSGFDLSVEDVVGGALVVAPGRAYTPRGDLVVVDRSTRFAPPADLGWYVVGLDDDGCVVARQERGLRPVLVPFGRARAEVRDSHGPDPVRWVPEDLTAVGRVDVTPRQRAHVASGHDVVEMRDVEVDWSGQLLRRSVVTTTGQFERTPVYLATLALDVPPDEALVGGPFGWVTEICGATRDGFTLRVHLRPRALLGTFLQLQRTTPDLTVEVLWTGVDPARPQAPAPGPACSEAVRPRIEIN